MSTKIGSVELLQTAIKHFTGVFIDVDHTTELTMTQDDGTETKFGSGIYAEWIARLKLGLF